MFLLCLIILQIALAVYVFMNYEETSKKVQKAFDNMWARKEDNRDAINVIQRLVSIK